MVSVHKGGIYHFENLWLLCAACNSLKGTGTAKLSQQEGKHGQRYPTRN